MSTSYGPVGVTAGQQTTVTTANLNLSCAIVANESPYTLKCSVDGTGATKWIHALTVDRVDIPYNGTGFTGNFVFMPTVVLTNTANAPSYALLVDTYGMGEDPPGTYPIALSRAVNIGNTVPVSNTTSVINDGSPANTTVVEATVTGSPATNLLLDNSGNVTVAEYVAAVRTILLQVIAGASTAIKLAASGKLVEALGGLQVDQNLTVKGSSSIDNGAITTDGAGNITAINKISGWIIGNKTLGVSAAADVLDASGGTADIYLKSSARLHLQDPLGTDVIQITAAKASLLNNAVLQWPSGSFKDITAFTGNGTGTYNHGLNTTPFYVAPICTSLNSSATQGYDSVGSTTVHVTMGASVTFKAFCYG